MRTLLITLALLGAACAHTPAPTATRPADGIVFVEAAPEKGFHYPYILRLPPESAGTGASHLVVEPNNTGAVSDDLNVHLEAARKLSSNAIGAFVAKRLEVPLLVPVFPRPETDWHIYAHMLDRDVMLIKDGPMRRLDLQLIAMIDDARARLRTYGFRVDEKVLMTGFSASGTFSNRFTLLHPERVRAVASGGLNGLLMVPSESIGSTKLPYPLGLADLRTIANQRFDERAWRAVPQFIYMGALDDNDALKYDDGYDDAERAIVYGTLGEAMQPDRWQRVQAIYKEAGANATFRTYEKVGHWTDQTINSELTEFFRQFLRK